MNFHFFSVGRGGLPISLNPAKSTLYYVYIYIYIYISKSPVKKSSVVPNNVCLGSATNHKLHTSFPPLPPLHFNFIVKSRMKEISTTYPYIHNSLHPHIHKHKNTQFNDIMNRQSNRGCCSNEFPCDSLQPRWAASWFMRVLIYIITYIYWRPPAGDDGALFHLPSPSNSSLHTQRIDKC